MLSSCVSVVIGDRNPVFLHGLVSVLKPTLGFKVVARCADERTCLQAIRNLSPTIALVDCSFVTRARFDLFSASSRNKLRTRVVVFAPSAGEVESVAAGLQGRFGVLPKDIAPRQLNGCLRQAAAGTTFSPLMPAEQAGINANDVEYERFSAPLTDREREIVELVSQGLSNKEIGRELELSPGTVKIHLHRMYQKLAVQNRTALAVRSARTDESAEDTERGSADLSPQTSEPA